MTHAVEEAFEKVKGLPEARSREVLVEARGKILDAVTARDAKTFL